MTASTPCSSADSAASPRSSTASDVALARMRRVARSACSRSVLLGMVPDSRQDTADLRLAARRWPREPRLGRLDRCLLAGRAGAQTDHSRNPSEGLHDAKRPRGCGPDRASPSMALAIVGKHAQLFEYRASSAHEILRSRIWGYRVCVANKWAAFTVPARSPCDGRLDGNRASRRHRPEHRRLEYQLFMSRRPNERFEFDRPVPRTGRGVHDGALLRLEARQDLHVSSAAPVRCISAARKALSTCLRRSRAISFAQRPASHASRHNSSDSGSCPGATKTSPRSITAMAMIAGLRQPELTTTAWLQCETTAARGRNAGEFATRMTSPASAGSDWISRASCAASVACCAVSSASCAQTRGKGAMFCGTPKDSFWRYFPRCLRMQQRHDNAWFAVHGIPQTAYATP